MLGRKNHSGTQTDMPLGISMALSQNPYLYNLFASLSPAQREEIAGMQHKHGKFYDNDNDENGEKLDFR